MSIPRALLPEFEKIQKLWKNCDASPDRGLLRLALLRDLQRALHARQSHFLATGQALPARTVQEWEARVEALRTQPLHLPEVSDLSKLLIQTSPSLAPLPPLPPGLFLVVDRARLERLHRAWEYTLAARACALGWKFWKISVVLEIPNLESWNLALAESLWPEGITLYVESGDFKERKSSPTLWLGHWTILLSPRARLETLIEKMPLLPSESIQWNPLFDPLKECPKELP